MTKITVGVADDHPVVLIGINSVLKNNGDLDLLFSCEKIQQLILMLQTHPVDVLLCDYEFNNDPIADGLTLLKNLRRTAPNTKILILSAHSSPAIVAATLETGVSGFIGKSRSDFGNIATAVRTVAAGRLWISKNLSETLLPFAVHRYANHNSNHLSPKESSVARMTADGLTIREIANRLQRSPKTISNQKIAAMRKLGAKNDVELATLMHQLNHS
ncbi:response regulator [Xanthomonas axonopodis]|uniref:response regulator n=1 Tax=Xanthomonas axonopodis TaxID=53413 RepID=UPI003556D619